MSYMKGQRIQWFKHAMSGKQKNDARMSIGYQHEVDPKASQINDEVME